MIKSKRVLTVKNVIYRKIRSLTKIKINVFARITFISSRISVMKNQKEQPSAKYKIPLYVMMNSQWYSTNPPKNTYAKKLPCINFTTQTKESGNALIPSSKSMETA